MHTLHIKRVYDPPEPSDGRRVLVDRLWPRGLSKERAGLHLWLRDIAPSDELRKRYHGGHLGWEEFRDCYFRELFDKGELVESLLSLQKEANVTLLYSSREPERNNAAALREFLLEARGYHAG
ncbi:MAG: DUF488 domain-containing protein [Gammaproteobacteria bacterium]